MQIIKVIFELKVCYFICFWYNSNIKSIRALFTVFKLNCSKSFSDLMPRQLNTTLDFEACLSHIFSWNQKLISGDCVSAPDFEIPICQLGGTPGLSRQDEGGFSQWIWGVTPHPTPRMILSKWLQNTVMPISKDVIGKGGYLPPTGSIPWLGCLEKQICCGYRWASLPLLLLFLTMMKDKYNKNENLFLGEGAQKICKSMD